MITRRRFLVMLGATGVVGLGVVGGAALLPDEGDADDGFPVIRYGEESCARCGMIIDDVRFAAAWSGPGRVETHFDDIGCALMEAAEHPPATGARCFVHDYESEQWLDAPGAAFVLSPAIRSPMAYGVAALASVDAAGRVALEVGGKVHTFDVLPLELERSAA